MAGSDKRLADEWKSHVTAMVPQLSFALLLSAGVLYGGYYLCDCIPIPKHDALGDKFIYFIRCCVFPCALVLAWSIASVAGKRGQNNIANPLVAKGEEHVQSQKNILSNTMEQSLVFLMTCLVLTTYLERSELQILPVFSFLWVIGRVTFAIGYAIHPKYRSVGIGINFPTGVFFFCVIGYLMYTRGFMYGVESETRGSATPASSSKAEL